MTDRTPEADSIKPGMHPRNPHRSRYDFAQLISACPELQGYVKPGKYSDQSIDFANPKAVKMLNKALLKHFYGIAHWDIPDNYLCPPIPGRADYIHHMADLLAEANKKIIPTGPSVRVLDIGVGANCIYPIIGHQVYGWQFVGSDIDPVAIRSASLIIASNPSLKGKIECRLQSTPSNIFSNILKPGERFDLCICNPPFHSSAEEAASATGRKTHNLSKDKSSKVLLNFGGQSNELTYEGGEAEFVRRMIKQSAEVPNGCRWFSTLISRKDNLYAVNKALKKAEATEVRIIEMAQGHKQSRLVAWTFHSALPLSVSPSTKKQR